MRVLLAFALLLGFSLTTTASAADWSDAPAVCVELSAADAVTADALPGVEAGATVLTVEAGQTLEAVAPECVLVAIVDYYINGEYVGSDYYFICG